MKLRRDLLLMLALALSACSAAASGSPGTSTDPAPPPAPTLAKLDESTTAPSSTTSSTSSTSSTTTSTTIEASTTTTSLLVGEQAAGNRVLMIGDSILASTSARYGGTMCAALVPLGWQVEIDAESGRFIEFGEQVLRSRLSAGWDASVIMLGNNFDGNVDAYRYVLTDLVNKLSPQPVVLLTVTEFRPDRAAVNGVIRDVASTRSNVTIVDWSARTADAPDVLGGDGLHLSDLGRTVIAGEVAARMGAAPVSPGKCLSTRYTDDSAGPVTGTTVRNRPPPTARPRPSSTTVRPSGTTRPPSTQPPPASTQPPPVSTQPHPPPTTEAPKPKPTEPPRTTAPPAPPTTP